MSLDFPPLRWTLLALALAGSGGTPAEIAALRRSGLASSAQYRYRLGGERPGQLKVRVDVFREADVPRECRGPSRIRR